MQNTELDRIAKVICNVDLDRHELGWHEGQFYAVDSSSLGYLWRTIQKKMCTSTDCDYELVADKIRDFLTLYRGGSLEQQVANQLTKLENKVKHSVKGRETEKVTKVAQLKVGKMQSVSGKTGESKSSEVELSSRDQVTKPKIGGKQNESKSSSEVEPPARDRVTKPTISFSRLFWKYETLTRRIATEYEPYLPYAEQSCRCNWIFCPSKTNVKLTSFPEEQYGYIHANKVSLDKGIDFIATIYPYQRTMFWSMALEHGNSILDVTNGNDLERNAVTPYYPERERQKYTYGKRMEVTCLRKETVAPTLIKYQLKVKDLEKDEERVIDRFHYIGWEDVCGTNEEELFDVVKNLESYLGDEKVPLVHCMGGVGRTGTALTAFALKALIDAGKVADENSLLDHMQNIILEGRKQRGPEYVQTPTQIETLYKFGLLALKYKAEKEE